MLLINGDCLEQLKMLPDHSVDAIVSDPPYGVPSVEVWKEALRVLKPGGHALIACGTRTQHRMVVNIEDAGFEIRDVVSGIYDSGFTESLNISKAIDKAAGAERDVVGVDITAPEAEAAQQGDGWGTVLKPACDFFTLCRKPLSEKDRDEGNHHPTAKPTALMQYLCRLITPPGGTVLDPYMGSGSTGKAAVKEGFDFVGIELDPDYFNIAKSRIASSETTTRNKTKQ